MYKPHVDDAFMTMVDGNFCDNDDNNDVESSTSCPKLAYWLRIGNPQHGDSACERIATKSKMQTAVIRVAKPKTDM